MKANTRVSSKENNTPFSDAVVQENALDFIHN